MKRWEDRIIEARERGHFTVEDCKLAGDWVTCACGQQDPRIARDSDGAPVDKQLMNRGCDFFAAVRADDFDEAAALLDEIEKRAAEVLSEGVQS